MKTGRPELRDKVIAALPGTLAQIERKSGVSGTSARRWTSRLRKEGVIHIGGWRRSSPGGKQPVFVMGAGEDKPPPKTLTPAQIRKRFRKRHPERFKEIQDLSYRRTQTRERGHGFLAALFF